MRRLVAAVIGSAVLAFTATPSVARDEPRVTFARDDAATEAACIIECICPALAVIIVILGGGLRGVVEGNSEGDLKVADQDVWDCPPYEDEG